MKTLFYGLIALCIHAAAHGQPAPVEILGSFNGLVAEVDVYRDPASGMNYAYAIQGGQVHIYNLTTLRLAGTLRAPAFQLFDIHVSGNQMALAAGKQGAMVYDLANPAMPRLTHTVPYECQEIWLGLNTMLVRNYRTVHRLDRNASFQSGSLFPSFIRGPITPSSGGMPILESRFVDLRLLNTEADFPYRLYRFHEREYVPKFIWAELDFKNQDATFYTYMFSGLYYQHESNYHILSFDGYEYLTPDRQEVIGVRERGNYRVVAFKDSIRAYRKDIPFEEDDPPAIRFGSNIGPACFDNHKAYLQSANTVYIVDYGDPQNMAIETTRRVPFEIEKVIGGIAVAARGENGISLMRLDADSQPELRIEGEHREIRKLWGNDGLIVADTGEAFRAYRQTAPDVFESAYYFDAGPDAGAIAMDGQTIVAFSNGGVPFLDIFDPSAAGPDGRLVAQKRFEDPLISHAKFIHVDTPYIHLLTESNGRKNWQIIDFSAQPRRTLYHIHNDPETWIERIHNKRLYYLRPNAENPNILHCMDMSQPDRFPLTMQYPLPESIGEGVVSIRINNRYLCILIGDDNFPPYRNVRIFNIENLNAIRHVGDIVIPEIREYETIGSFSLHGRYLINSIRTTIAERIGRGVLGLMVFDLDKGIFDAPIVRLPMNFVPVESTVDGLFGTVLMSGGEAGIHAIRFADETTGVGDWAWHSSPARRE